jgi:hypothetical protein
LALALHLLDKVLAFGGGDSDTLHGRPSLWWLDGFGVFTMPQEMAVCSIILCIYLVELLSWRKRASHVSLYDQLLLLHYHGEEKRMGVPRPWR